MLLDNSFKRCIIFIFVQLNGICRLLQNTQYRKNLFSLYLFKILLWKRLFAIIKVYENKQTLDLYLFYPLSLIKEIHCVFFIEKLNIYG